MIFRAIILCKNSRWVLLIDEIIAKFVPIKKRNIDFSYAATENINTSLNI
jgi:hypothetical protein